MKYKERVIKHNIDIPELRTVGYSDMTEIYYDTSVVSHHPKSLEYYFTHGIVVNEKRYIIKEFFVRDSKLYAVITEDESKYYELYLSFMEEDTIEIIKKEIEELDKQLKNIKIPESKPNQTLSLSGRTLSISDGNSVTIPEDKDTIYNDEDITRRLTALEGKTDNFVTGVTASRNGNRIRLTYNFVTGQPKDVEFDDKDTIGIAYDDTALRNRVKALENRQSSVHRFYDGNIPGTGKFNETPIVNKSKFINPDDIKVGDTVEDHYADSYDVNRSIWKVVKIIGNDVKLQGIGNYNIDLRKNLHLNTQTRILSIIGGKGVTLPNDKQTISKDGNKIILSNGGGEVELPKEPIPIEYRYKTRTKYPFNSELLNSYGGNAILLTKSMRSSKPNTYELATDGTILDLNNIYCVLKFDISYSVQTPSSGGSSESETGKNDNIVFISSSNKYYNPVKSFKYYISDKLYISGQFYYTIIDHKLYFSIYAESNLVETLSSGEIKEYRKQLSLDVIDSRKSMTINGYNNSSIGYAQITIDNMGFNVFNSEDYIRIHKDGTSKYLDME